MLLLVEFELTVDVEVDVEVELLLFVVFTVLVEVELLLVSTFVVESYVWANADVNSVVIMKPAIIGFFDMRGPF